MMGESVVKFTPEPVAPSAFVGRAEEIELLLSRACLPIPPLQTLEGPSKMGRTSMLLYLQAISRSEIEHELSEALSEGLVAPYIDLTLRHDKGAREVILEQIIEEMKLHELSAPASARGVSALPETVAAMKPLVKTGDNSFLLLIDHVEHLLLTSDTDEDRQIWRDDAMALLGELSERVRFAVLLGFGTTGPARELRQRERRMKLVATTIGALSHALRRGDAKRTTLKLLDDDEVREFATAVPLETPSGHRRPLTPAEVEWVVDTAGGHPMVMQNAGILLAEEEDAPRAGKDWRELEQQLADPGLLGFVFDAFQRIGPINAAKAGALEELAAGGPTELDPDLTDRLGEEGFIRPGDGPDSATMPSGALRAAMLNHVNGLFPPRPARTVQMPTRGGILALRDEQEGTAVRLTPLELAITKTLLEAGEGGIASRATLKAALGRRADDPQLTQRVSVLRNKLREHLGISDAIESVYGEGYRLVDSNRYVLSETD